MRFRIHFVHADNETEDSFDVEGDSLAEVKLKAFDGVYKRNGHDAWSEELERSRADEQR